MTFFSNNNKCPPGELEKHGAFVRLAKHAGLDDHEISKRLSNSIGKYVAIEQILDLRERMGI